MIVFGRRGFLSLFQDIQKYRSVQSFEDVSTINGSKKNLENVKTLLQSEDKHTKNY